MITELKDVIQKVEELSDDEQRMIAKMLEEELQWDKTFHDTKDELASLAKEAIEEYKTGRTKKEDW